MQPAASWPPILANAVCALSALGGSALWVTFALFVSAVDSRGSFNREPMRWMMLLGGPLLIAGFALAIAGFESGVRGHQKRALLMELGSFIVTSLPGFLLVAGFFIRWHPNRARANLLHRRARLGLGVLAEHHVVFAVLDAPDRANHERSNQQQRGSESHERDLRRSPSSAASRPASRPTRHQRFRSAFCQ
jgi:hypothetical protein